MKKVTVVPAPRDNIGQSPIELEFLSKVLHHPEAFITDESDIYDFLQINDVSGAHGPSTTPGKMMFKFKTSDGRVIDMEMEPDHGLDRIKQRCLEHFNVDISNMLGLPICKIIEYIDRRGVT